jgi:hypothetical protein
VNTARRNLSRSASTALILALVAVLAGCGNHPDAAKAPRRAAVADFCAVVKSIDLSDPKKFVAGLKKTGTPEGIPGDARAGFEVMIENADKDKISSSQQDKVSAFVAYFTTTCA